MSDAIFSVSVVYPDPDANPDFAEDFPDLPDPAPALLGLHPHAVLVPHDTVSVGEALIEDSGSSGDEVSIDFGDVAECTGFFLRNASRQDLSVAINGVLAGSESAGVTSAAGTLNTALTALASAVATLKTKASAEHTAQAADHTAEAALATAITNQFAILNAFDGLDDAADIVAAIATAYTAISGAAATLATADAALVTADGELVTANTAVSTTATTDANTALIAALDADGTDIFTMPHGSTLTYAQSSGNADTPVESISLFLTDTQVGDGFVEFEVFGEAAG